MKLDLLIFWMISLLKLAAVKAQNCLEAAGNDGALPNFSSRSGEEDDVRITHRHQAIVESYQFQCCGNVTEWGAEVAPSAGDNVYDISFQVWRPSPTVEIDGCYSMVGQNVFTSVTMGDSLVMETPAVNEQISFEPGDVVGLFVQSGHDNPTGRGVVMDTTYDTEAVWYGSIDDAVAGGPNCPFPVGTQASRFLRTSTNVAPVISVSYMSADICIIPTSGPLLISSVIPTPSSTLSSRQLSRTISLIQPTPTHHPTQPTTDDSPHSETTTDDSPLSETTTDDSPPSETTTDDSLPGPDDEQLLNNLSFTIGVAVAVVLVMVLMVLVVVTVGCVLRARLRKKLKRAINFPTSNGTAQETEDVAYDTADDLLTNDAYVSSTGSMNISENIAYGLTESI